MADNSGDVHITGTDLPAWATETTAEAMASNIADLVEISTRTQREIVKELKTNGKVTDELVDTLEKGKTGLGADLDKASDAALNNAINLGKVNKYLPGFATKIKESSKSFKLGLAGITGLFSAIAHAVAIVEQTAGAMQNMTDQGISFTGGLRDVQASLADTGMTLDELQTITGKYAQVVGTNGWAAINKLTRSVNDTELGMAKYGLTTADATEYTAEYLEQQRLAGVFGAASQRDQSKAVKDNIERLTAYSKTLNISRKAMMETTTSMLNRDDVQAQFALMTPEARKKANAAFQATIQGFASLGPAGEKFGSLLTDMIANPTAEASESFKQIAQAAPELAGDLANMARRVREGEKVSQEEIMGVLERAGKNKGVLEALTRVGGEMGDMANQILIASTARENAEINELRMREEYQKKTGDMTEEGYKENQRQADAAAQLLAAKTDKMAKIQASIQEQMMNAFLDLVGDDGTGMKGMLKQMDKIIELIRSFDDTGWVKNFRAFFHDGLIGAGEALAALSAAILFGPSALIGGLKLAYKGLRLLVTGSSGAAEGINALVGPKQLSRFKKFGLGLDKSIAGMSKMGGVATRFGLVGAAAMVGLAAGTLIYKTFLKDTFAPDEWKNYDPNAEDKYSGGNVDFNTGKVRTPDEQRLHEEMRAKRRMETTETPPTTGAAGAATQTTAAIPQMSEADAAKLDIAGQQVYWIKRLFRHVEAGGGLMA